MAVLRPYWKCLQNLNDNDPMYLNDYLRIWEQTYRQNANFYDNENPPDKFELTGFYPLYPEAENIRLDEEIDDLIKATDLFVPKYKTGICVVDPKENLIIRNSLKKGLELEPTFGSVIKAVCKRDVNDFF